MKKQAIGGALLCLSLMAANLEAAPAARGTLDIAGLITTTGLGDSDLYDFGAGVEAQVRFWLSEKFGWAGVLGLSQWEASSSSSQWGGPIEGEMRFLPVGASLIYRTSSEPGIRLVLEAGLRYAFVSSDVDLLVNGEKNSVSIENGVLGVVAADLERNVGGGQLFAGVAYQLDLQAPDASWSGGDLRENSLEAASLRLGFRRPF